MVVDVILTEAMVTLAAGTVAEFKVGILRVRAAADCAFAGIWLAFSLGLGLAGSLFEVDDIRIASVACSGAKAFNIIEKYVTAEDKIVQDGNERDESEKQLASKQIGNDTECEEGCIDKGQPFYFYGDEEEQKYPAFRE